MTLDDEEYSESTAVGIKTLFEHIIISITFIMCTIILTMITNNEIIIAGVYALLNKSCYWH